MPSVSKGRTLQKVIWMALFDALFPEKVWRSKSIDHDPRLSSQILSTATDTGVSIGPDT